MKKLPGMMMLLMAVGALAAELVYPRWQGWEQMGAGANDIFSYRSNSKDKLLVGQASAGTPYGEALRKDADYPLTPELQFVWQWNVQSLPGVVAEDKADTHKYFAVSVIFDNGKNLSYIWSIALPVGYSFQCPLPGWEDKETHVVVQTGSKGFNKTLSYQRNIVADYTRYIGGKLPEKVAKVWIVALTKDAKSSLSARISRLAIVTAGGVRHDYL